MTACLICHRDTVENPMVCQPCRTRLDGTLRDIGDLHAQLPDALVPGSRAGEPVSGTRNPPLPINIDPLDLTMPARALGLTATGRAHRDDQTGDLSVASVLASWVDYWREYLYREHAPRPTVPHLVKWLRDRHNWACDNHPAIADCNDELRGLRRRLLGVLGQMPATPELLHVPCRQCDKVTLFRRPGDERIHCQDEDCAAILYPDEYERWTKLLAGHHHTMA